MARTSTKPTAPKYKEKEYDGYTIRKWESGKMFVISEDGEKTEVANQAEAIELIDSLNNPKEILGPIGGDMGNAPISCKYKKIDKFGTYWIECCICIQTCQDVLCKCHEKIMSGRKQRIAALNYHSLQDVCPACESTLLEDEDVFRETWEYSCGSTGYRRNGNYDLLCKLKKVEKPKSRRRS